MKKNQPLIPLTLAYKTFLKMGYGPLSAAARTYFFRKIEKRYSGPFADVKNSGGTFRGVKKEK